MNIVRNAFFSVIAVSLSAPSFAGYIAQTDNYVVNGAGLNDLIGNQWNDSPGQDLEKVIISWNLDFVGTFTADECLSFGDCEPGTLTWRLKLANDAPASQFEYTSPPSGITNNTDAVQNGSVPFSIAGSLTLAGADILPFSGAGTYWIFFDFEGGDPVPDGFGYNLDGSATGAATVQFQVPVPATIALLGLGLTGLGWFRRRRA